MTKHRPHRYTRPDANQAQIVKELICLGFDVDIVCALPNLYDIIVSGRKCFHNEDYLLINCPCSVRVEIKPPGNMLSPRELEYYEAQKHPDAYIVARSTKDVLEWFGNGKS